MDSTLSYHFMTLGDIISIAPKVSHGVTPTLAPLGKGQGSDSGHGHNCDD